jgi:multiple sugar transport system substrate-binding protein
MIFNNQSALYTESVVDLSDLAEEVSSREGGLYKYSRAVTSDGKKFNSMPWTIVGAMNAYRKSWFEEVGVTKFPETWDAYYDAGKRLKAKGHPFGQAVSHSFGDPPTFVYPLMWSYGGKEVEADGKTVAINSKNTIDSVKFMTSFYKDTCDEGGLAWDDTSNNRAFLSQTISSTLNGASIYIESLRNPDKYITEKGAQLKTDILHAPLPKGPEGQFGLHTFFSHMLMSYSPNQKVAKDLLRWLHTPANYEKWFISQKGFATPPTAQWENHELWVADSVMDPFKVAGKLGQAPGFAGPAGKKAAEALTKYIIVDMYAKAIQGATAEDAVKWAEGELKKIYT